MASNQIERICNNCRLFNPKESNCSVTILMEGRRYNIPVDPEDPCFFEQEYFDPQTKKMENFAEELKEVKFWLEDESGKKVDKKKWWQFWRKDPVVKMEYPTGFFGTEED